LIGVGKVDKIQQNSKQKQRHHKPERGLKADSSVVEIAVAKHEGANWSEIPTRGRPRIGLEGCDCLSNKCSTMMVQKNLRNLGFTSV
jgi:hypothetical protein